MSVKTLENLNKSKIRSTLLTLPKPYDTAEDDYCLVIRNAKCVKEQINCVRNIFNAGHSDRSILRFLCALYFVSPLQHPLRQQIAKLLATADTPKKPNGLKNDVILELLTEKIQQIISEIQREENNCVWNAAIVSLLGCFENFDCAVRALERTIHLHLPLAIASIEKYMVQMRTLTSLSVRNEYYIYIHNSIRLVLFCLKKFDFWQMKEELHVLEGLCHRIIGESELPMDSRTNAGIITAYIARLFNHFEALMVEASNCQDPHQIAICMGVISVCNQEDIVNYSSNIADMCSHIIHLANTHLLVPNTLLAAARALQQISKLYLGISAKDQTAENIHLILQKLLSFATMHLEHFIDSVRYLCREILHNVLVVCKAMAFTNPIELVFRSCNVQSFTLSTQCLMLQTAAAVVGAEDIIEKCPELFTRIFPSHLGRDLRVNNLFEALMLTHYKQASYERWLEIWIEYLLNMAAVEEMHFSAVESLLVKAVQCDSRVAQMIIEDQGKSSITNTTKLLALWTIRKSGTLFSNFNDILQQHFESIQIAIISNDDETRIAALRPLVETHKTTEQLTLSECGLIILYLKYNINCQSPAIRQQSVNLLTKALVRCELNLMKIAKSKQKELIEDSSLEALEVIFLRNLILILVDNLHQSSNFSRRSISLQLLEPSIEIAIKCNINLKSLLPKSVTPILYSVLSDSYEIHKKSAVKMLLILENLQSNGLIELNRLCPDLDLITNSLSSIRPSDSLTASYQLEFLCNVASPQIFGNFKLPEYQSTFYAALKWLLMHLTKATNVAKYNIMEAAISNPLYGLLVAIGHLLNKLNLDHLKEEDLWCNCLTNIIEICLDLTSAVAPITNSSSPEGYLPNVLSPCYNNPLLKGQKVTSQMVLLCAWRTIKEISSILGYVVLNAPITANTEADRNILLTEAQILQISETFKSLLLQTKHRGAFEQVYIGFSKLCSRLWTIKIDGLNELPFIWLKDIIELISAKSEYNEEIGATRRSAGIPFLIQAILISELKTGSNKALNYCMTSLLQISCGKETCCVSRTHAFNILRALFRCTDLNEAVGEFISDGVEVAIQAYDSDNWMEKNSATLLFAALIVRIFGVQRTKDWEFLSPHNRMTSRIFFMHYPKLFEFFLQQLQYAKELIQKQQTTNKLHPLLIILGRLYPSSFEGISSNIQLRDFLPYIDACAAYGKLPTRLLAAKATVSIISSDEVSNILYEKCVEIAGANTNTIEMNRLHGILLQILYLIRNRQTESIVNTDLTKDIVCTLVALHKRINITNSIILTTILDILIELINSLTELKCTKILGAHLEYFATLLMEYKGDAGSLILCPILFKSNFIYQLHRKRLSETSDLVADYLVETTVSDTSIELTECCLNVILLIVCKMQPLLPSACLNSGDSQDLRNFDEFNIVQNEWLFVKALPAEKLNQLATKLCSSQLLQQTLKHFLKNPLYYPEIAIKSYAILSRLDDFDFSLSELIDQSESKSSEIKSAIAFCIESLIRRTHFDRTKAELCLTYLANVYEAWQPSYLRYKAAVILSYLSSHYSKALNDLGNHLTFVRTYIKLILNLLMDDDQDIRGVAVNIVLKDLQSDIKEYSLANNKFLNDSIDLNSILPKVKTVVTTIAQNLFLQNTAQTLYALQTHDDYIIDVLQGITHSLFYALAEKNDEGSSDNFINAEIFEKNESNTFAEPTKAIIELILIFQSVFATHPRIQCFLENTLKDLHLEYLDN